MVAQMTNATQFFGLAALIMLAPNLNKGARSALFGFFVLLQILASLLGEP